MDSGTSVGIVVCCTRLFFFFLFSNSHQRIQALIQLIFYGLLISSHPGFLHLLVIKKFELSHTPSFRRASIKCMSLVCILQKLRTSVSTQERIAKPIKKFYRKNRLFFVTKKCQKISHRGRTTACRGQAFRFFLFLF